MQILTPEQAKDFKWDILDIIKVWPHAEVPPIKVGKMVLNHNPVNYFAEVEQAAFCPGNPASGLPSGSRSRLLQARSPPSTPPLRSQSGRFAQNRSHMQLDMLPSMFHVRGQSAGLPLGGQ
jgi:catalase